MALFGNGGTLELSREWPKPMALAFEALNATTETLAIGNPDYWTGDRIVIAAADGLPLDLNGDGYADCPEGHGVYYGSTWDLGPARIHVTASSDDYYQNSDAVPFYNTAATTGFTTQFNGYINMDALDRAKVYGAEIAAHNADVGSLVDFKRVKTSNFIVARYSANATYTNAVTAAANSIKPLLLPSTSQPLEDVITVPAGFAVISDDPEQRGWLFQAQLQEWALDIDASGLDMTAIGQTFGEQTKSLVRGAGALNFLVEHHATYLGQDSLTLLRLVLLTQQSAKSNAKFYIYKDRNASGAFVEGSVYYQCDVLLTNSRIDIRMDEAILGSADFVVTGEVAIKIDG
jgi:hypothetical protein